MLVACVAAAPAAALDVGLRDVGGRAGVSLDPDQIHIGVDARVAGGSAARFHPSLELGLGNGLRLLALNGDILFDLGRRSRRLYVGGGPALTLIDVTDGVGEGRGIDSELAVGAVAGMRWGGGRARTRSRRYLVEVRAGIGDTPDLKLTIGASF